MSRLSWRCSIRGTVDYPLRIFSFGFGIFIKRSTFLFMLRSSVQRGRCQLMALAMRGTSYISDWADHLGAGENPQEFADAIWRLLSDEQLADQIGRRARVIAEKEFAWPILAASIEALYYLMPAQDWR